jgi:hypothetical protein
LREFDSISLHELVLEIIILSHQETQQRRRLRVLSNSLHFLLHLWSSPEAHTISSKSENKDTQEEELGAMTQSTG